jgi:hypothetical protein
VRDIVMSRGMLVGVGWALLQSTGTYQAIYGTCPTTLSPRMCGKKCSGCIRAGCDRLVLSISAQVHVMSRGGPKWRKLNVPAT